MRVGFGEPPSPGAADCLSADLITLCATFLSDAAPLEHHMVVASTSTMTMVQWLKVTSSFWTHHCHIWSPKALTFEISFSFSSPSPFSLLHNKFSGIFTPNELEAFLCGSLFLLAQFSISLRRWPMFLVAVTVQRRNASATHIIAFLQESIDLHPSWYPPLSSASPCPLKWSLENELLS